MAGSCQVKGERGRETRYGPKWPAPVGVCRCMTGTDLNGQLLSGEKGVIRGQRRT